MFTQWPAWNGVVIPLGCLVSQVQDDEPKAKAKKNQATWSGPVPSPEEELKLVRAAVAFGACVINFDLCFTYSCVLNIAQVMVVNEELKMTKGKIGEHSSYLD
jgi:hypothetical protein